MEPGIAKKRKRADRTEDHLPGSAVALLEKVRRQRHDAQKLIREFRCQPPGRLLTVLKSSARYQSPPMVECLCEEALKALSADPRNSLLWARLAVHVADLLDPCRYGNALVDDYRGRARVYLANAQRRTSDLRGADASLTEARRLLQAGTGDWLEEALLVYKEAQLRKDQRRFGEAISLIGKAIAIYRWQGDRHAAGTAMIDRGLILMESGEPQKAIPDYFRAASLVDARRDPRSAFAIHHNLARAFVEAEMFDEALHYLKKAQPLYRLVGLRDRLYRWWLEGTCLWKLGRRSEALASMTIARDGFVELELPLEAAELSLEMALILAEEGRTGELRRLVVEMLPIFQSRGLEGEVLVALMFFCRAVEGDTATVRSIRHVLEFTRKLRRGESAVFRSPVNEEKSRGR